ncbi:hypothetical protein QM467_03580 [Rhodoblastus sp. 17X3]|uniref:hypothetical protein n=1 Tax=Rhodoblastus sp. 17X3 TaxID=3047026 RepID=UPI0024B8577D|nr:hypothetical protein [Rhodoblastus sp. 17X3]MDI9847140.1 hypothetical protein [Rhodoblastus sp. 17X3]
MTSVRLKAIVFLLLASIAGPAMGERGSHLSRGYRPHFPHRNFPRVLPGPTIVPNIILPAPPAGMPMAPDMPPASGSAPFREPSYSGVAPSLSQGMVMTIDKIVSDQHGPEDARSSSPVTRPIEAARALAKCWAPPIPAKGETVEVTIRFGFDSGGSVRWPPRITYVKAAQGSSQDVVRTSILDALKACTPLNFTKSMAASAPGYPLTIRFIGRRGEDSQSPGDRR